MRSSKYLFILLALLLMMIGLAPASAQNATALVVWDSFTSGAEPSMIEQLDAQFEAAHPGVTIQRAAYSAADLAQMLPDALAQPSGPDVALIDESQIAALVQAHLLLPLGDYADSFKWWNRYSRDLQANIGISGEIFDVPVTAELVAMFYNRDIFARLGLQVPTTWDDLESDLQTIKGAGIIPVSFGNGGGAAGVDTYGALAYAYSDIDSINALVNRADGGAFMTEGDLDGAQTFVDWIDAGYFSSGFAHMDNDAALAEFTGDKSALWLASSNNAAEITATLGQEKVGFFLLPSPVGDTVAPTVGRFQLGYGIRQSSANSDLAVQYIDFMSSPDAANALIDSGILPAPAVDPSHLKDGTLMSDLVRAWATISAADRVAPSFEAVLPNLGARIQALAAHTLDPESFAAQVEQDYEAGK